MPGVFAFPSVNAPGEVGATVHRVKQSARSNSSGTNQVLTLPTAVFVSSGRLVLYVQLVYWKLESSVMASENHPEM